MRVWRVSESLPADFRQTIERNLRRHAFRPIDVERGEMQSLGWVNLRQLLDTKLTVEKALVRNYVLLALRVDRLAINQKLFRATLAREMVAKLRERDGRKLSREERLVLEDQVRMDLIKRTQPVTTVHEMAWNLETGLVFFTATAQRMNMAFADLFAETFQVVLEPRFPFLRAQDYARRQGQEEHLLELLPAPFSPLAPVEVVEHLPEENGTA